MRDRLAATALVALLVAGCLEPELVDEAPQPETELPDVAEEPPVDTEELDRQLAALERSLDRLEELLEAAEQASELDEARDAGRQALAELVDDDPLADGHVATELPLLPATTPDRAETPERPATLISALTAARDRGGQVGRDVAAMLSDDVAGDLGAWQRDAEGVVAAARSAAESSSSLPELEATILELPGEGTRTLAWTMVLVSSVSLDDAHAAAHRARAHVGLMASALQAARSGTA